MTKNQILDKAKRLNISAEVNAPGDGKRRYNFFTNGHKPFVFGRELAHCIGAREAELFLRGFDEGLQA